MKGCTKGAMPPSVVGEMPPPSVELTMIGVLMRAHLASLSPKKRAAYLCAVMEALSEFEDLRKVVRLRSREYDEALVETQKQAVAWTRGMTSAFFMGDCLNRE